MNFNNYITLDNRKRQKLCTCLGNVSTKLWTTIFFLSNDLHILQTACMANKNRTQNTIWKTKQHKHWTLCAIVKSNKVIKTKEM